MTETGRGTIDTHLADGGSFALCDLDTEIDVGDPVLLTYEDADPSADDIKSVQPVPEAKRIFDSESDEQPSQE
jgi:hypothetical protein